jgi:DNA-binding NarL/FixJ family response regulator
MQIKIALADDHQLVRGGIKLLLENFPEFKVNLEASNGIELLDKIRAAKSPPQIALVDVSMPVMDGFETSRQLNIEFPKIKVIALSVHDDLKTVSNMIESGAHAYLLKDSSPEVVKETLLQVAQKGYYYSQFVIESLMQSKIDEEEVKRKNGSVKGNIINGKELLTSREIEFIKYSCSEMTYKEIADVMNISHRTVDGYRESVFSKLDIKSRTGIVLFAFHEKLVSL